jgi:hypothetical protein
LRRNKTKVKRSSGCCVGCEMLENGTYATIAEIAKTEKIGESYVGRVMRLMLLRIGKGLAELN